MRYVDNAGTSWPKPNEVHAAETATWAEDPRARAETLARAHASVAADLGAPDPDRLWLTAGCTAALAIALGDFPWQPDDTVLTSALEHHALARPVAALVAHRSLTHVVAPWSAQDALDPEFVDRTMRARKVALVAVTAASNVTGQRLPLAALVQVCRAHGARLLVDAAQVAGVDVLDLGALGADLVTFAGHKGPLGPQGIGGLWVGPEVRLAGATARCEGDTTCTIPAPLGYCDLGSVNVPGAAGLAAGLHWSRRAREPWARAHALASRLRVELRGRDGVAVFCGDHDADATPTVSFSVDGLPISDAGDRFAAAGISLRAGSHCAPAALAAIGAPHGTIRASFGPFNEADDVDAILRVVDASRSPR